MTYTCPVCYSNNPNLHLRCNNPNCMDGRVPKHRRIVVDYTTPLGPNEIVSQADFTRLQYFVVWALSCACVGLVSFLGAYLFFSTAGAWRWP